MYIECDDDCYCVGDGICLCCLNEERYGSVVLSGELYGMEFGRVDDDGGFEYGGLFVVFE